MPEFVLLVIVGFLIKHFVADYLLQFRWMIAGKGSFTMSGGYIHAGIHSLGSVIVLLLASVSGTLLVGLVVGEFIVHYLLDYLKVHYGSGVPSSERPKLFWALNGLDQMLHHLTYVGMTYCVVLWGMG